MAKRQLLWLASHAGHYKPGVRLTQSWDISSVQFDCNPNRDTPSFPFPRVGLLDLSMPDPLDLDRLHEWIRYLHPAYWVGILRESPIPGSISSHLIGSYCFDFHTLPCDEDRLHNCLGHLWGMAELKERTASSGLQFSTVNLLDGHSLAMTCTRSLLLRYAHTQEPVLILGQSGTGKESAARFIHDNSSACQGPFVAVHCAALPESLTQSELFGHEKGAFTSAVTQRIGRIEAAEGGTLLLDGIDELLPQQQSVLLRFLQEGHFERLGSQRIRRANVRVISTSSTSPERLIEQGRLRPDLYYRISVLQASMPPLRERLEDLPLLIEQILAPLPGPRAGVRRRLTDKAFAAAIEHDWPGNIRELQNRLTRAVLMSESVYIEPGDMDLTSPGSQPHADSRLTLERFRAEAEKRAATHALALSNHNLSAAARLLNISRLSLYRIIDKHGLERNGERRPLSQTSRSTADYRTN